MRNKVLVRRVGEHAGAQRQRGAGTVGEIAFGEAAQQRLVGSVGLAQQGTGGAGLALVVW